MPSGLAGYEMSDEEALAQLDHRAPNSIESNGFEAPNPYPSSEQPSEPWDIKGFGSTKTQPGYGVVMGPGAVDDATAPADQMAQAKKISRPIASGAAQPKEQVGTVTATDDSSAANNVQDKRSIGQQLWGGFKQYVHESIVGIQSATLGDVVDDTLNGLPQDAVLVGGVKSSVAGIGMVVGSIKAINLPGWSKITVDMAHIADRHMTDGTLTDGRSVFVDLSESGVMAAIKQAYGSAETIAVQGDRVLLSGLTKTGMQVEMWLNKATNIIETAYPVPRK